MISLKRGVEVICQVRIADSFFSRLKGLMFKYELPRDEGLLIEYSTRFGSRGVHGFFMRFSLDLIFMEGNGRVVEIGHLPKWGYYNPRGGGIVYVLEVNTGFAIEKGLQKGDLLSWQGLE